MTEHRTASRQEWLAARRELLAEEKELTRRSDELARKRQQLPWVPLEKEYVFETLDGPRTLADLFDGRSQLLVYHFMLHGTDGCAGCSLSADHFDGPAAHLNAHDVSLTAVSRESVHNIEAYKSRMGWHFPWVSSLGSDFNYDFGVSLPEGGGYYNFEPVSYSGEMPGMSAFALQDGVVHHTYSSYARGGDVLMGVYQLLDRAPLGRNEQGFEHHPMEWVRRHDEYESAGVAS